MSAEITTKKHWVAKFGGTSLATHDAMSRCAKVLAEYPDVRLVIVSAPAGVTNLLVKIAHSSKHQTDIKPICVEIREKIQAILDALPTDDATNHLRHEVIKLLSDIENLGTLIKSHYSDSLADEILSHGERMSARLFTCVLLSNGYPAQYQDAREIVRTDNSFSKADVHVEETKRQAEKYLLPKFKRGIVVSEGFIGSTPENITTTLGRGGSDYSAAILAEASDADVLQIWTDVAGIYTVDPRIVKHATPIDNMCFTEAAELAQFGAKVLHPATLWPAIRANIPVFVGSSMNCKTQGTWIRANTPTHLELPLLRAIAVRQQQSLLTVHSLEMLHTHGFLARIFTVLAKHKLSVDLVTTSEVSVALTLNQAENGSHDLLTPMILEELLDIGNVSLTVEKDLCLIALVGNQLHMTSGISGRVFKRLSNYNIRLICHGASSHNLCFLVAENDAKPVVQALHSEFFEA